MSKQPTMGAFDIRRLHPEARRLLDERELLEGTGSKDVPRGIVAYGQPGYSLGFGPIRCTREEFDAVQSEQCARERARRAEWSQRRQERRARRLGLSS